VRGDPTSASASAEVVGFDARAAYREHCAECHGERRYGGYAPPLIPDTLSRKSDDALAEAILQGLPNTQMPPFAAHFAAPRARRLVALLREPIGAIRWSLGDIAASRVELPGGDDALPTRIRRENLTLVVERGRGAVAVLDGDTLEELDRFPVGRIHGGLKFDRSFRKVLAITRDGTALEYDLAQRALRTRVKVGVNSRNIALSPDGDFAAVANQLPPGLVVLDGKLRPLQVVPLDGQPSGVYPIPGRRSFVLTQRDVPRLYEVDYPALTVRSLDLPEPFEDFVFVPGTRRIVASSRGGHRLLLFDLDSKRLLASLATEGLPHLFSACFFSRGGVLHAAFNHVGTPRLSIIDMESFAVREEIPLRGSGYFARTHEGTPYLWIDTNTDGIQLVEKKSLELSERSLTPEPGKKAMHVEFTVDGDKAFVSVWHQQGAVVVYDSTSLEEIARLPYAMPVGKYNAGNKTRALQ
jgi:hypothetical protein